MRTEIDDEAASTLQWLAVTSLADLTEKGKADAPPI
jgi:hypothetical protein